MITQEQKTQTPAMAAPRDLVLAMGDIGWKKTHRSAQGLFLVGVMAGIFIAYACIASTTATYAIAHPGIAQLVTALIFPFGLVVVVLTGSELFTGNCLIPMAILQKKATLPGMFRNWIYVYLGNFAGSILMSFGYSLTSLGATSDCELAMKIIRIAVYKVNYDWAEVFLLSIFCNVLVVVAVLISTGAQDLSGKFFGCYVPIALFVMGGFEHCVANMYYITAGIFASSHPEYAQVALAQGMDLASLSWGSFLWQNLIPVTLGNTLGGVVLGLIVWYCNLGKGGDFIDRTGRD